MSAIFKKTTSFPTKLTILKISASILYYVFANFKMFLWDFCNKLKFHLNSVPSLSTTAVLWLKEK